VCELCEELGIGVLFGEELVGLDVGGWFILFFVIMCVWFV